MLTHFWDLRQCVNTWGLSWILVLPPFQSWKAWVLLFRSVQPGRLSFCSSLFPSILPFRLLLPQPLTAPTSWILSLIVPASVPVLHSFLVTWGCLFMYISASTSLTSTSTLTGKRLFFPLSKMLSYGVKLSCRLCSRHLVRLWDCCRM